MDNETFRDGIVRIAGYWITRYTKDGELQIQELEECMLRTGTPVAIFKQIYYWSVRDGMKPLEELEPEEKKDLWRRSGRNEDICKALHVIQSIYQPA